MKKIQIVLVSFACIFSVSSCSKTHDKNKKLEYAGVEENNNKLEIPPHLNLYQKLNIDKKNGVNNIRKEFEDESIDRITNKNSPKANTKAMKQTNAEQHIEKEKAEMAKKTMLQQH